MIQGYFAKTFMLCFWSSSVVNLTLSWRRSISYRNQTIDLPCKSVDWFLLDRDLRHERVNSVYYDKTKRRLKSLPILIVKAAYKQNGQSSNGQKLRPFSNPFPAKILTSHQRCFNVVDQCWNNVVDQRWNNVCDVETTLIQLYLKFVPTWSQHY